MKKSISVVIALLLLVNVFAVSAFAAVPAGNAIALTLTSDKDSYAAGDTAMITLSVEAIAGVPALCAGEIEVSYNDAIFAPAVDISATASFADYGCTLGDIIAGENIDAGGSFIRKGSGAFYPSDESAYGWNAGLHFCAAKNYQNVVAVDCTAGPKTFITFPIKINAGVADGTYTIGVNEATFEDSGEAYLIGDSSEIYGGEGSQFGVDDTETFACGTLAITVGEGGSTGPVEPTVKVNNLSTQVQWANKDAGLMNLGFRGQIADGYNAETDKDGTTGVNGGANLAKLTEVGFYLNNTKYQAYTIYNFVDGGYFYRVVVGNVSYDSETEFSAQAYVVIDGTEYKADDATTITTTGKAQYERAKDAMGAK